MPGSKKERPNLAQVTKQSSTNDWSMSSEVEELSSRITTEKEILALFEKMMVSIEHVCFSRLWGTPLGFLNVWSQKLGTFYGTWHISSMQSIK